MIVLIVSLIIPVLLCLSFITVLRLKTILQRKNIQKRKQPMNELKDKKKIQNALLLFFISPSIANRICTHPFPMSVTLTLVYYQLTVVELGEG